MTRAWRIVREDHGSTAFDGEGAWRFGGRWNSRGTRTVYTSATLSLAALETLVHLNPPVAFKYVAIPIEFDEALVETLPLSALPSDWTEEPPSRATQDLGDRWIRESRSVVLEVPSVLIPGESNYLINPGHPEFRSVSIGPAEAFPFNPRLL
jgi:RES domain-containing protein